ncbi:MAG: TonB-dependent receptor [Crocinitomicaceae bacterium]
MHKLVFLILMGLTCVLSFAQQGKGGIKGQLVEAENGAPLEYVPVKIYTTKDSSLINGALTDSSGSFFVTDIENGNFYVSVVFFGFQDQLIENIEVFDQNNLIDLGVVKMEVSSDVLDEVMVIGRQQVVRYEIDKKIIDVSQDYANSSATAFDVLSNTPSITADMDGNLSLRGSSSFTLFIDGKPTSMDANDALKMISASNIENIEIMTNPSAKYDAEGVSGIINIITKDSKQNGTSALINLGGGIYNRYNGDVNVQIKRDKIAFNFNANYRNSLGPSYEKSSRNNYGDSITNTVLSEGTSAWGRSNYGGSAEMDWDINKRNSLKANFEYSGFMMSRDGDLLLQEYENDMLVEEYTNIENGSWDFKGLRTYLDYFHYFNKDKKHFLSLSGFYRYRDGLERSETNYYALDQDEPDGGNLNIEAGPSSSYRFKADYQLPFKNDNQFQAGALAEIRENTDQTDSYQYNAITGEYDFLPLFSTDVSYQRNVYAAYSIFNGKVKKFGYQLGMRAEYTDRQVNSTNTASTSIQRLDWFPSVHSSYQMTDKTQFMLSYSRKIQRPRGWYLEPFITWTDVYSVRTGNPDLDPEYITAVEGGWIQQIKKKGSFSLEAFYRFTTNKIERITTIYEDNIVMRIPENIGTASASGIEASWDQTLAKWWRTNLAGTAYYFTVKGQTDELVFDQETFSWTARWNNTFTLKANWRIQFTGMYNSAIATAQGRQQGFFNSNLAIRKEFWDRKASCTLQLRDVFSTTKNVHTITSDNLSIYSVSEPRTPSIVLGISFRLNNYEEKRMEEGNYQGGGDDL